LIDIPRNFVQAMLMTSLFPIPIFKFAVVFTRQGFFHINAKKKEMPLCSFRENYKKSLLKMKYKNI
jgi:hypothetical protein